MVGMVGNCSRAQELKAILGVGWTYARVTAPNRFPVQQSVGKGEEDPGGL